MIDDILFWLQEIFSITGLHIKSQAVYGVGGR